MKKLFATEFDVLNVSLIPICISLNLIGSFIQAGLILPGRLDTIGTCFGAMMGGPVIGIIIGAASTLLYDLSVGVARDAELLMFIVNAAVGLTVGVMTRLGFMKSYGKSVFTAIVTAIVSVAVVTPINLYFFAGDPRTNWSTSLLHALQNSGMGLVPSSILAAASIEILDKVIIIMVIYWVYLSIPDAFKEWYHNPGKTIEHEE